MLRQWELIQHQPDWDLHSFGIFSLYFLVGNLAWPLVLFQSLGIFFRSSRLAISPFPCLDALARCPKNCWHEINPQSKPLQGTPTSLLARCYEIYQGPKLQSNFYLGSTVSRTRWCASSSSQVSLISNYSLQAFYSELEIHGVYQQQVLLGERKVSPSSSWPPLFLCFDDGRRIKFKPFQWPSCAENCSDRWLDK